LIPLIDSKLKEVTSCGFCNPAAISKQIYMQMGEFIAKVNPPLLRCRKYAIRVRR
jgi:hypothetical protein